MSNNELNQAPEKLDESLGKKFLGILLFLWEKIRDLLGFRKHNKYVSRHLNDANIRTSIYMCAVIIIIEVWMIIRSGRKYVGPAISKLGFFNALFTYTSLFFLFIIAALAMMLFAIFYLSKKNTKVSKIVPLVFSGLLLSYSFFIFKEAEAFTNWNKGLYYRISYEGVIAFYLFAFLLGLAILGHTLFKIKYDKDNYALSIVITVMFALMCLAFGVKVGYTDFFSRFNLETGLPKETKAGTGIYEIKSMLCFLTMVVYVGCLLIWKPYISIAMLTSIFMAFYGLLDADPKNRLFADGEKVNYITFLISLCIITLSIYQQRFREAKKSEDLRRVAIYDEVTEIHNHYYFEHKAREILQAPNVSLEDYIYLFVNIENFKVFNDQRGFSEGNIFLKSFAKEMERIFTGDVVTRQADDHFGILAKASTAKDRVDELNKVLNSGEYDVYLELKVGAFVPQDRNEDPRRALDKARYASGLIRHKFGVAYNVYDDAIHTRYQKRQYIVNHIDQAVSEGWIKAYYQPVVWSDSKELCGCEALARWIDPNYGMLSPGDFIPVLEEHRLIHKLDKAIFEIVCKDMRKAIDEKRPFVPVSLNFSRLDFELMDAVTVLDELASKYDIPRDFIHVEVTESALSDNLTLLKESLDRFHDNGFAIWLDDFGSGYSSLNVLKDYKFDVLKIDMKFLSAFETNPKSKDIIQSVVDLASKVGMKTLTEGVETEEQAKFLNKIGCGRLQGYLFGRPLPLNEIDEGIEKGKYKVSDHLL